MPCQDFDTLDDGYTARQERIRLDKATRVACEALRFMEDMGGLGEVSKEARAWWKDHKQADEHRRERERAAKHLKEQRERALRKLTIEERVALGLHVRNRRK